MRTNCAHLFADFFLFSYELKFSQTLVKNKMLKEARSSNYTFRHINDVINSNFSDRVQLIYPKELNLKETTGAALLPHFETFTSNFTYTVISEQEFMKNETIIIKKL